LHPSAENGGFPGIRQGRYLSEKYGIGRTASGIHLEWHGSSRGFPFRLHAVSVAVETCKLFADCCRTAGCNRRVRGLFLKVTLLLMVVD